MTVTERTYELVPDWARIPDGWRLEQTAIAIDGNDRVYLFNRSEHPMMIFERDGSFVDSWGEGRFPSAHGIYLDAEDHLYLPVINAHAVVKCDTSGNELMTLGTWGAPSNTELPEDFRLLFQQPVDRASPPFSLPTDVAVADDGTIYVTDGYGNARVHVFDADGTYRTSWGRPGSEGPSAFHLPHGVWVHHERVYVVDRENNRVQIFDRDGGYLDEWTGFHSPCDIFIDRDDVAYVAEGASAMASRNGNGRPNVPGMLVRILTLHGDELARFGGPTGGGGHNIAVDSDGSIYVNQNIDGERLLKFARTG